jgi:aryl-alcohol dehydrogenase-like predicted oxidoreductase
VDGLVRRAVELGINYFDTAEIYNNGRSEAALGLALRGIPRDQVIIGSKVTPAHCYHDTLIASCEASLRRLQTDYIDLYLIHWPLHPHALRHVTNNEALINHPPSTEEAASALQTLQAAGKIRHIGVSNFASNWLDKILETGVQVVANQLHYNLLSRAIEADILPYCLQQGVGILGYMTILQGVLAGKYKTLAEIPAPRRRTRHFHHASTPLSRHGEEGAEVELQAALIQIQQMADEVGMPMSQLATRWAFSNPAITCAIVGARNVAQLEAAAHSAAEILPADLVERLNQITQPLKAKLGPSFDYYEHTNLDRTRTGLSDADKRGF